MQKFYMNTEEFWLSFFFRPLYSSGFYIGPSQDIPQSFMQNFVLKPSGDSFFIQHDVFRLVIHNVAAH